MKRKRFPKPPMSKKRRTRTEPDLLQKPKYIQSVLFELSDEWKGMPDFSQEDLTPRYSIVVHFSTLEDVEKFATLIGQTVTPYTRSIWYPAAEIGHYMDKLYVSDP